MKQEECDYVNNKYTDKHLITNLLNKILVNKICLVFEDREWSITDITFLTILVNKLLNQSNSIIHYLKEFKSDKKINTCDSNEIFDKLTDIINSDILFLNGLLNKIIYSPESSDNMINQLKEITQLVSDYIFTLITLFSRNEMIVLLINSNTTELHGNQDNCFLYWECIRDLLLNFNSSFNFNAFLNQINIRSLKINSMLKSILNSCDSDGDIIENEIIIDIFQTSSSDSVNNGNTKILLFIELLNASLKSGLEKINLLLVEEKKIKHNENNDSLIKIGDQLSNSNDRNNILDSCFAYIAACKVTKDSSKILYDNNYKEMNSSSLIKSIVSESLFIYYEKNQNNGSYYFNNKHYIKDLQSKINAFLDISEDEINYQGNSSNNLYYYNRFKRDNKLYVTVTNNSINNTNSRRTNMKFDMELIKLNNFFTVLTSLPTSFPLKLNLDIEEFLFIVKYHTNKLTSVIHLEVENKNNQIEKLNENNSKELDFTQIIKYIPYLNKLKTLVLTNLPIKLFLLICYNARSLENIKLIDCGNNESIDDIRDLSKFEISELEFDYLPSDKEIKYNYNYNESGSEYYNDLRNNLNSTKIEFKEIDLLKVIKTLHSIRVLKLKYKCIESFINIGDCLFKDNKIRVKELLDIELSSSSKSVIINSKKEMTRENNLNKSVTNNNNDIKDCFSHNEIDLLGIMKIISNWFISSICNNNKNNNNNKGFGFKVNFSITALTGISSFILYLINNQINNKEELESNLKENEVSNDSNVSLLNFIESISILRIKLCNQYDFSCFSTTKLNNNVSEILENQGFSENKEIRSLVILITSLILVNKDFSLLEIKSIRRNKKNQHLNVYLKNNTSFTSSLIKELKNIYHKHKHINMQNVNNSIEEVQEFNSFKNYLNMRLKQVSIISDNCIELKQAYYVLNSYLNTE